MVNDRSPSRFRWQIRQRQDIFGTRRWWITPPITRSGPVRSFPDFETARAAFARGEQNSTANSLIGSWIDCPLPTCPPRNICARGCIERESP